MSNLNEEQDPIKEVVDRTRRIETKLTRLLTGDSDRGVTKVMHVLTTDDGNINLRFNTRNVTISQVFEILVNNRIRDKDGNKVYVYENDTLLFTIGGTR